MTDISNIFDAYEDVIAAVLPSYYKIPNGYDIAANSQLFFKSGFAISIGPATNTNRQLSCQISIEREITVTLVLQLTAALTDFSGFNTVVKNLFEDQYKIIKAIEKDQTLNDGGGNNSIFTSDGGLEFVDAAQAKYFQVRTIFQTEYFENLNT